MDLPEFSELTFEMLYCKRCPLHLGRTCVVPGAGARNPELFFVGEGPGEDEDKQGLPFVGRSGKLLTSAIAAAGLTREQVFISNIVKCRPPNNRDPPPKKLRPVCRIFTSRYNSSLPRLLWQLAELPPLNS